MSYNNGNITAPISIRDLQRCFSVTLEAMVGGQRVSKLSSDLATIIACNEGDTITDSNGTTWTIHRAENINTWAKYRPIAVAPNDPLNVPRTITDEERERLGWGMQIPYDPANMQGNETLASYVAQKLNDAIASASPQDVDTIESNVVANLTLMPRKFQPQSYKRITDFVSSVNPTTIGYNHQANPYQARWHFEDESIDYAMGDAIVPNGNLRENYEIEDGSVCKITAPNDCLFIDGWQLAFNNPTDNARVVKEENTGMLSIIDSMVNADKWVSASETTLGESYSVNGSRARGVVILVKGKVGNVDTWLQFGWYQGAQHPSQGRNGVCYGHVNEPLDLMANTKNINGVTQTNPTGEPTRGIVAQVSSNIYAIYDGNNNFVGFTPYSSHQGARAASWKDLQGKCLFVEYYHSDSNAIPIPQMTYFVNINRVAQGGGSDSVDIEGVAYIRIRTARKDGVFVGVFVPSGTITSLQDCVTFLQANYSELNISLSNDKDGMSVIGEGEYADTLDMLDTGAWDENYCTEGTELINGVNYNGFVLGSPWPTDASGVTDSLYVVVKAKKQPSSPYAKEWKITED